MRMGKRRRGNRGEGVQEKGGAESGDDITAKH